MTLALIPFLLTTLAVSPNLVENSGFELSDGNGWQIAAEGRVDHGVAHSGKASFCLSVPGSAAVSWYQATQRVLPLKRGATYTISAYVRTKGVRDGAGAYVSIGFYAGAGKRLGYADSPVKLKGDSDWRQLTASGRIPDGSSVMRAVLVLHGHGTAWFDDVQVEEAPNATPYQPSSADATEQARRAAEARAAAAWIGELPPRRPGQARVAILDEAFPAGDCQPSDPAVLAHALSGAGYACSRISAQQLGNAAFLKPAEFALLVIPSGDAFPADADHALVAYLSGGGALLTTGGYALDRPLVRFQGKWCLSESLPTGNAPATPAFPAAIRFWRTGSNRPQGAELRAAAGPDQSAAVELHTAALDLWATAVSPSVEGKLPPGWSLTSFWARGDDRTTRMAVEWQECDGSRWKKVVPLSTQWQQYTLFPGDFAYWQDNPSVGRGGPGDRFHPRQARRMQFGLSADVTTRDQPHSVWVADVRVRADAAGDLRRLAPHINTRWARIRDAMFPDAEQIGAFDPSFPLRDVARTRAAAGQTIVTDFESTAPLRGYSAVAMLGLNGHGFGPNRARWVPLLECLDWCGRPRGHAGAIIHHFSGTFAGSSWAIFGATNSDLFAAGAASLEKVLLPTVAHLLRRFYVHDTDSALACYREGESVTLRTKVSNFGRAPRRGEVRFTLTPEICLKQEINVRPGETMAVELAWKPGRFTSDYYPFAAELWEDGRCLDREENAFVAWNPAVLARGTTLHKDGTRFVIGDRPQFLMGCQTYWGQNTSVTARSPAAFDRDFRQMREFGLRWTRCFLPFKTEEDKRISDAVVQLAQKYGLVLYHTPNLRHTADPAELAAEQATARELAVRYRGVPGLAVDICNEPSFRGDDAPLVKTFGRPGKTEGRWDDLDVAAFWRCMAGAERAWEIANAGAIHAGDPLRLASVGWSQGWGGGPVMKDPVLASLDLDFTDRHYYGPPAGMPPELKDLDLRGLGKPLILGECGAKDHPSFRAADPWGMGDDDDGYDLRFLSLAHQALGVGAAAISSWHWRDPMEGIFPCGIVHQTGVPRPTALAYRAMAIAFGRLRPVSVPPQVYLVLPDSARMGGQRNEVIRAWHRAAELLVACRVDFGLLPDSALERLPAGTKAIVYPLPLDPSDAVVERLAALADRGAAIYVSGDISYDERRRAAKPDRLRRLCGVEKIGAAGSPFEAIRAVRVGAEIVPAPQGQAAVTRFRRGKGQVWFAADPVELARELKVEHRDLYRSFLHAAGTPGIAVAPDRVDLHVFRVPGEDADALVLHNGGLAVDAEIGEFTVQLAAGGTGYLLVGHDRSLRAIEAQGAIRRGGKEVASIEGHAFVVAMDNVDLARSRSLLALPLAAGRIRLHSTATEAANAEAGEMCNGQWKAIVPVRVKMESGCLAIPIATALGREMIRVTFDGAARPHQGE
jgi:hypothetical protein